MFELTQNKLHQLLSYAPDTGQFTWLKSPSKAVRDGSIAGSTDTKGRRQIKVLGQAYFAHRLAFLWMLGRWPHDQVDHINRDYTDNSWANLRDANAVQNVTNKAYRPRKNGLPRGVHRLPSGRFQSCIGVSGRLVYLGAFDTSELAHEVYVNMFQRTRDPEFIAGSPY